MVFYRQQPLRKAVAPALRTALETDPASVRDIGAEAAMRAQEVAEETKPEFAWGRLVVAFGILILLLVGAVITGKDESLGDLYGVLLHALELGLGGVLALLLGESASAR